MNHNSAYCGLIVPCEMVRILAFEFSLLVQNNMRGKFTRGNPQEFPYQIRSHSETEWIRRVSSTSSKITREETRTSSAMYYNLYHDN